MRFLVDNALSPLIAKGLAAAGYDAIHVLDYRLESAPDIFIFSRAREEGRALLSLDTDFASLLALGGATSPSVILLRRVSRKPPAQLALLLAVLPELKDAIEQGSIVTIEALRIRIRRLPLERG